eukprot:5711018-Prorocentrum_lima.AAC.1
MVVTGVLAQLKHEGRLACTSWLVPCALAHRNRDSFGRRLRCGPRVSARHARGVRTKCGHPSC